MLLRDGVTVVALGVWLLAAPACGGDTSDVGGGTGAATGGSAGTSAGTGGTSAGTAGANGSAGANGTAGTNGSAGVGGSGHVDGGDVCSLPREVGDCRALIPRFWFNAASGRCESFTYGGCGGNANNFETPSECVDTCAPGTGNVCSKVTCDEGAQCVFVGAQPAACLRSCDDPGACPPSMTCECGGSCPGCENCIRVCVPL